MSKLSLNYDVANLQPADANPVEANFNTIVNFINQELIERDGSVAMRQQLRLMGNPINPLDAAPKQYVDQLLPIGIIVPFGGTSLPSGDRWLICDGSEYQTADYPELFAVIGTNFTVGTPGAGRFMVPNMVNRFPMGAAAVGSTGGSADGAVMPHTHAIDHDHPSVNTSFTSNSHQHQLTDHLHAVNLNTADESNSHYHTAQPGAGNLLSVAPGAGVGHTTGGAPNDLMQNSTSSWNNTGHTHPVNGNTGGIAGGAQLTGGASVDHRHTVDIPAATGTSGPASGAATSITNANLPPYVGTAFIIRAK